MNATNPKPPRMPWQDRPILCGLTLAGIVLFWGCIGGWILRAVL